MTSGSGLSGSLGHGNTSDVAQLRIVESLLGVSVKQVACGSAHVVAVSVDHQVYAWGCGSNGETLIESLLLAVRMSIHFMPFLTKMIHYPFI